MLKIVFRRAVVLGMLGGLFATSSSMAAMFVTTGDGNGADTSLQNDSQNGGTSATVFGAGNFADFRRYDDVRQKMLLVRFDISDLDASTYADAVLRFDYNTNRTRTLRVYGIGEDFDDWDEATTSYSNAPGILQPDQGGAAYNSAGNNFLDATELYLVSIPPPMFQLGSILIQATGGTGNTNREVVLSNTTDLPLETFLNADTDGLVSFLLFHDGSDSSQTGNISTKERGYQFSPMLGVIPTQFIPEPSSVTLALLGLGAIGALARRR